MNIFRLWAQSNPAPNHMFGKWQSQDSNPEGTLGLPGSSQAVGPLPGIHTSTGGGLETALAPVPSPQAGHEDLEAVPLYTQTCLSWWLPGKSGAPGCTRRGSHLNLPSHKDSSHPILVSLLSGLSYKGLTQLWTPLGHDNVFFKTDNTCICGTIFKRCKSNLPVTLPKGNCWHQFFVFS